MPTHRPARLRAVLAVSVPAICAASAACAEAPPAPTQLAEIVVTATRDARRLADAPVSVSLVAADQIRDTPAKSLDDVLRRIPSVDLPAAASYQLHPTAVSVSMRGLGGLRALVMLDGVPLNDAFFGYVQWNRVPLETIQRVEVVRGGGATLWGNYAMGGVINVITAAPDSNQLVIQGGGGSYGTWRGDAHAAYVVSDEVKMGLQFGASHTDGFDQTPAAFRGATSVPTSFTAYNAAATGDFRLWDGLDVRLRASWHDNDQDLLTRLAINTQRIWNLSVEATQDLGGAGRLTAAVFHSASRFRTDNTDTPSGAALGSAEFVQNRHITPVSDTGASLTWSRVFDGALRSLSVGADYHGIAGTDVADIFDDTGAQVRTDIGRGRQQFLGVFGQASLRPMERLEILASARFQHFRNYDGFDGSAGGLGAVPDRSFDSVDPRVSARYALTPAFALRAAGYEAFRAPTLDNLYRTFSTAFGIFYGNPALRPETLKGGEVGFDVERPGLRIQATAFTNTVDDLLTARNLDFTDLPPGFFFGSRNINAGSARSRGLESEAQIDLGHGLEARLGYTFADSIVTGNPLDPASIGRQQAGVPRYRASAGLTYSGHGGLRLSVQGRWLSRSWSDNDHTLPIDSHVVIDLSARYPLVHGLEGFVQIENLLDRRYVADNSGFSPPQLGTPLTVFAGLRAVFQ